MIHALYRIICTALISLLSSSALAMESMVFKQPLAPHSGWLTYGMIIVLLLIMVLVIAKKHRPILPQNSECQLIEKKYLGNKTVVYVIDYQKQRFLLADNQQSLAFHVLNNGSADERI